MTNSLGSMGGQINQTKKQVKGLSERGDGPNSGLIEEQSDEDY